MPIHAILVDYRDGLRGVALKVGNSGIRWNFACQLAGESTAAGHGLLRRPLAESQSVQGTVARHPDLLPPEQGAVPRRAHAVDLSGILDAAMDSRVAGGTPVDTPQLDVAYTPPDFRAMREMGATWKMITEATKEPPGIEPVAIRDRPDLRQ